MPTHSQKSSSRWRSYFFLLVNVVCWGAALVIVKPSLDVTTPFRFLLYRFFLAGLLSLGFIWHDWQKIKKPYQAIFTITKIELVGITASLALLYIGLSQTTALAASLVGMMAPVFVTIAGILLLREREERHEWAGLGLAFLGTVLIVGSPLWQPNVVHSGGSASGNFMIILSDMAAAIYYVLAKKYYQSWPKLWVASISFWVGAFSFAILALAEQNWQISELSRLIWQDWHFTSVWVASAYMAIFGSIIGLTAYIRGQSHIEASEASVFFYLQPLIYLPLASWLLHEQIGLWQIIGLGVILAGVVLTETRRRMI